MELFLVLTALLLFEPTKLRLERLVGIDSCQHFPNTLKCISGNSLEELAALNIGIGTWPRRPLGYCPAADLFGGEDEEGIVRIGTTARTTRLFNATHDPLNFLCGLLCGLLGRTP